MIRLGIKDRAFGHAGFSNNPMPPVSFSDFIEWDRAHEGPKRIYTDAEIPAAPAGATLWLLEPQPNQEAVYNLVRTRIAAGQVPALWTHDAEMMALPGAHFVPFGGCWIPPTERRIHAKTRNISIIASHKDGAPGQAMRHQAIQSRPGQIDAFGGPYSLLPEKLPGLRDYRYSLAFENWRRDYWFTEKLIDCFATGTIPIYWGCPSIDRFFNPEGMICIEAIDDLPYALTACTEDFYRSKLAAVAENFERAKEYFLTEDWIARNRPDLIAHLAL